LPVIIKMMGFMRQVVIYAGEDDFWIAEFPSLPGCISQGETREKAIATIKEAIRGYVKALEAAGLQVPAARFATLLVTV
jgi:predicted RNase H-like HicB family nuclease